MTVTIAGALTFVILTFPLVQAPFGIPSTVAELDRPAHAPSRPLLGAAVTLSIGRATRSA